MIQARRLGHATFETPDLEKAIAYYTHVNGLVVAAREKNRAFLATKIGQLAIQLDLGKDARCTKLSFEVAPSANFGDMSRGLASHGIKSDQRSDAIPGLPKVLAFQDPKGTTIELFSHWSFLGADHQVMDAGPLKFGHIAFVVPDPKAFAEFYQSVLGFRISDWIDDFFVFLRCNSDHHAVNFIKGRNVKVHHFAFELKDFAHMQSACELLGQKKIPIIWGPVRLGPGHNVAIFHRNADDQVVEFYAELDQMKDEALGYYEPRPWHRDQPQRPKIWSRAEGSIWGPPPTADFFRDRD
jgi:catechol 2,3-dioxygenase-like lactoylglutathione lyase family enzyme